jgi:two-component system, NtrC family, response regulator GlrR
MQSGLDAQHARLRVEGRKPVVTFIFDRYRANDSHDLLARLNGAFTCSAHCLTSGAETTPACQSELVIWQRNGVGTFLDRAASMAIADLPAACPLIVVADTMADVAFDLAGRTVADFVVRPYSCEELIMRARRVLGLLQPAGREPAGPETAKIRQIVVGTSAALTREVGKLQRFAACDAGVLVLGETGTGKEVFAQAIHYASARAAKPMVAINCGAVPAELMEAELFGHVKGAYTNAHMSRTGLVHEAEGGTLLLDDIDCLTMSAQAKLLRFLQEREYRVVGSNAVQHADVRIIAASNRDLAAMARQGTFRDDLFYRLNVLTLSLPPLREHKEDIVALAEHFLRQFAQRYRRPACVLSARAVLKLLGYDWPGNVRELGHVLERAFLLSAERALDAADLDLPVAASAEAPTEAFQAMKARIVQSFERSYIESILVSTNGNITEAARVAGKNRRAFFELIRKHEIAPAAYKAAARA